MKKLTLTLCALAVASFSSVAFAQAQHKAGEDMAAPSKPSTSAEKQSARQKRMATSKEVVKKDEGRVDARATPAGSKPATAEEKAAARAKRQSDGKAAANATTNPADATNTPK